VVKPGGLREMRWHPNADEWAYFLKDTARGDGLQHRPAGDDRRLPSE